MSSQPFGKVVIWVITIAIIVIVITFTPPFIFIKLITFFNPYVWADKYERDAKKYWDIFYKRHENRVSFNWFSLAHHSTCFVD